MEKYFCDVIGCACQAQRFHLDGQPPAERLCGYHWEQISVDSPDLAARFVLMSGDECPSAADEIIPAVAEPVPC